MQIGEQPIEQSGAGVGQCEPEVAGRGVADHNRSENRCADGGNAGTSLGPLLAACVVARYGRRHILWFTVLALGGIVLCGAAYAVIGIIVMATGTGWVERLMPPVVTGSVVAVIGLNLAAVPIKNMAPTAFDAWVQAITFFAIALAAVFTSGMTRRLLILVGLVLSTAIYAVLTNGLGWARPIDFGLIEKTAWIGVPKFETPAFDIRAIALIVPVALILVAENLGHLKAVGAMTGRDMTPYVGRAFVGDAVATMVSASVGGTGVTTYAENIGVMAATRIYSTALFVVAALFAILLGFSPKFGALIHTIPLSAMGGVSIVIFGLITIAGARI